MTLHLSLITGDIGVPLPQSNPVWFYRQHPGSIQPSVWITAHIILCSRCSQIHERTGRVCSGLCGGDE